MGNGNDKIVRSVCYFTDNPNESIVDRVKSLVGKLVNGGFIIQTKRICSPLNQPSQLDNIIHDEDFLVGIGTILFGRVTDIIKDFYKTKRVAFNIELSNELIKNEHIQILFDIIKNAPHNTFNFAYVFNNKSSSPYFPAAAYESDGFSIGLQPTDISKGCESLDEWLVKLKSTWEDIHELFSDEKDYLGIDSSIAPIFSGKGSLVNFVKRLGLSFSHSVTSDFYLRITSFMKENNTKPVGLGGLMMPCLEDFELADEYEKGNFSIERNIFI